jgi:hypothetical protein
MPSFDSGTENQFTKGKCSQSLLVKELETGKVNVQRVPTMCIRDVKTVTVQAPQGLKKGKNKT